MGGWIGDIAEELLDALDAQKSFGRGICKGDVIGVDRGLYEHYAVYVGGDRVIHYAGDGDDFGGEVSIRETSFREFLGEETACFVCEFPADHKPPQKRQHIALPFLSISDMRSWMDLFKDWQYHLFSPEETVERAYSRLGERSYNLLTNNCEHFAIWCKTNISESWQVAALLGRGDVLRQYIS